MLAAASAQAAPLRIVDDRGVSVLFDAPPRRIVSMLPSLTETVCALGACDRLVGVDRHSNHPSSVKPLATLGGLDDANVEAIIALAPDVVLLAQASRVTERLAALGLKIVVLEPRTWRETERTLARMATLLGLGDAGAIHWRRMMDEVNEAASLVPPWLRGASVYYEVDEAPYAAGSVSFVGETLSRLGLVNIVPRSLGPFPRINPEFVVHADPRVILIADRRAAALSQRPGWARLNAIRNAHVCHFDAAQSDVLARAGPRLGDGALLIAQCLQRMVPAP